MVCITTPELQGIHDCRKMTHWNRRSSSSNFTRAATIALWALLTTCSVLQIKGKEQMECEQAAARGGGTHEEVGAPSRVFLHLSEFLALLVMGRARGSFRALYGMLAPLVWSTLPLLSSTGPVTAVVWPCRNRLKTLCSSVQCRTIAGLPLLTSCSGVQSLDNLPMEAAAASGSERKGKQSVSLSSFKLQMCVCVCVCVPVCVH